MGGMDTDTASTTGTAGTFGGSDTFGGNGTFGGATTSTPTRAPTRNFGERVGQVGGTVSTTASTRTTPRGWLREQEACSYIGCGLTHLRRLKADGLPYHLVDGDPELPVYLVTEIEEWWRNQRRRPLGYPRGPRQPRYRRRNTAADA